MYTNLVLKIKNSKNYYINIYSKIVIFLLTKKIKMNYSLMTLRIQNPLVKKTSLLLCNSKLSDITYQPLSNKPVY